MRRRDFILSAAAAALAGSGARAQPAGKVFRIGLLNSIRPGGPEAAARLRAFSKDLESFGWRIGRNVQLEPRWTGGDLALMRRHAAELVAMAPDVIVSASDPALAAFRSLTRTIPIVFVVVADPVGNGFVKSLARPGGNLTGFSNAEPALAGKWIELLREIAPAVRSFVVMVHPDSLSTVSFGRAMAEAARAVNLPVRHVETRDPGDVEPAVRAAAATPGSGLIVFPSSFATAHAGLIAAQAARHRVPAIYPFTEHVAQGGLISYGIDITAVWRGAPWYVDRILRGAHPGELPVQEPTNFQLAINLAVARALDLPVPSHLLARADEAIE